VLDERRGHQSGASSGKFTFSSQLTASRMSGGALVVTGAGYMFGTGVHVGKKTTREYGSLALRMCSQK